MTPYEIWVIADGREYPIVLVTGDQGLSDMDAKTLAVQRLQNIIDKINDPTPDTIQVRSDIITPPAYNVRIFRAENELEG